MTDKEAYNVFRIEKQKVEGKPFPSNLWAIPSVDRAHIHSPRLPRRAGHDEPLHMMAKTIDIKRKLVKIINVLRAEVLRIIDEVLCQPCQSCSCRRSGEIHT